MLIDSDFAYLLDFTISHLESPPTHFPLSQPGLTLHSGTPLKKDKDKSS